MEEAVGVLESKLRSLGTQLQDLAKGVEQTRQDLVSAQVHDSQAETLDLRAS